MALLRMTTQTLGTSYGAAIVIPSGWENLTVSLTDSAKEIHVEVDGTNEEELGAGERWSLMTPGGSTSNSISIKLKSDSVSGGAPDASVMWFQ